MTTKYDDMVWKILGGMPIEVFDEDDDTVWENETWELVKTRTEGDYKDSRAIGSANLITALNMVHQRLLVDGTKSDDITALSHDIFNNILDKFTEDKLIRKRPENIRKTFQLINQEKQMEVALKAELRKEISRIVDLMIQGEAIRESINELKKDIKSEYDIPVATITKIATIVRKENMEEEQEKWEEIKEYVEACL